MVQLDLPIQRLTAKQTVVWLLMGIGLAGCLKPAPTPAVMIKQAFPEGTSIPAPWQVETDAEPVADDWLKSLGDPILNALVAEAIANNLDLREAAERVTAARESVIVVGSRLLPRVGANLGGRATYDDGDTDTRLTVYAAVSWEIDVWGKVRASKSAALAGSEATALDYAFARQSLAATVAKSWYLAIETRQLVALAERSVDVFREMLEVVTARREAGRDSDLDVADTSAKLFNAHSNLTAARNTYAEAQRALEVLLGRYPAAELEVAVHYPPLPPAVAAGVPASLLERRPDLVAAQREVLAAFRLREAAKLAFFPDFTISLMGGRLDSEILALLSVNPWLGTAALGIFLPIYEGGALRARVKIATAKQAEAVAHYGAVALAAFKEVENALTNEELLAERLTFEQQALESRTDAVRIATIQYKAGLRDLLWVSNLQTAQLANEATVIKLRANRRMNAVQLHLVLGGSFDSAPAVEPEMER